MTDPAVASLGELRLQKLRKLRFLEQEKKAREQAAHQVLADVWQQNGAAWITERLDEHVWSKQQEILDAVRDHRRTAVRSCHGVGKSHIASRIVAWWLDIYPPGEAFVVTTAPTFAQVRAILWRYIRQAHRKGNLRGKVTQVEWQLDGELVAFGRKPGDHDEGAFQGIHAKHVLVVLDEASGIPEQLWVAADALTTNEGCRILAIGNPDNSSSYFARVCGPGSLWNQIGISAYDSPKFTGEVVPDDLAELLISPSWAEEKRVEWGEDNPIYRAKVLGEFTIDDPGKVVRASDVATCRIGTDTPRTERELTPVELGVDVGGGGDETVIRERRGPVAGREWRERSDQPADIAPMVLSAIRATGATKVKIDSIGIGAGLVGELVNLGASGAHQAQIIGVNVASASRDPAVYENTRAEMWWMARLHSQDGTWDLSTMENADTTIAQLLQPGWHLNARGRIQIEAKDEIRLRLGGRSPDNADALLLAFWTPQGGHAEAMDWIEQYRLPRTRHLRAV
jgi:hypothetical protein